MCGRAVVALAYEFGVFGQKDRDAGPSAGSQVRSH